MKKERKFRFVGSVKDANGYEDGGGRTLPTFRTVYNESEWIGNEKVLYWATQSVDAIMREWEEVFEEEYEFKNNGLKVDFKGVKISRLIDALREAEQAVVKLSEEMVRLREIIQDEKTN
jgi:hypothetical protein